MKFLRLVFISVLLTAMWTAAAKGAPASAEQIAFHMLDQDVRVADILQELQAGAPAGVIAFRNVRVVDPRAGTITPDQTVIVSKFSKRIAWTGDSASARIPPEATIIEGEGKYLAPGLVDMHVHSGSADGWLLNLANGVTAIREMDGFPWLLRVRDSVNGGRMLGPVLYVAGTIINAVPLEGYAVVPAHSEDARRIVRQQAACGYDFIKIHNVLPLPIFNAVAEQSRTLGIDVIGHIPHDITVDHALHNGKMRTTEHLKGFIIDRTLTVSDEDFGRALAGTDSWITPTLYTRRSYYRGIEAQDVLNGPAAKYVPLRRRENWESLLRTPPESPERVRNDQLGALFRESQETVMKRLVPLKPNWLAGTDAAGYPFNIMGFALLDELQLLQNAGLSPAEAVLAATSGPAHAMRQPDEFGLVGRQMRADLILLNANPLEDLSTFRKNAGVMARGVWLERTRIDSAMQKLAEIQAEADSGVVISLKNAEDLARKVRAHTDRGFVFDPEIVHGAVNALRKSGFQEPAAALESLAVDATSGPCALPTPVE